MTSLDDDTSRHTKIFIRFDSQLLSNNSLSKTRFLQACKREDELQEHLCQRLKPLDSWHEISSNWLARDGKSALFLFNIFAPTPKTQLQIVVQWLLVLTNPCFAPCSLDINARKTAWVLWREKCWWPDLAKEFSWSRHGLGMSWLCLPWTSCSTARIIRLTRNFIRCVSSCAVKALKAFPNPCSLMQHVRDSWQGSCWA